MSKNGKVRLGRGPERADLRQGQWRGDWKGKKKVGVRKREKGGYTTTRSIKGLPRGRGRKGGAEHNNEIKRKGTRRTCVPNAREEPSFTAPSKRRRQAEARRRKYRGTSGRGKREEGDPQK